MFSIRHCCGPADSIGALWSPRPDVKGREGILAVHVRKIPLSEDVDISVIARSTPGFSGADLANLVNEAALNAARMNQKTVTHEDFEMAKDKVLMGVARKSMIISEHEKRVTAYHEAGHAMVAAMTEGADPFHKVTIIPRGMALGRDAAVAGRRSSHLSAGLSRRPARDHDGWTSGRRIVPRNDDDRRRQRHRASDRTRAKDGLPVRHVVTWTDDVRQTGRADLPRPRNRAASRLQRTDGRLPSTTKFGEFVISGYERAKAILRRIAKR